MKCLRTVVVGLGRIGWQYHLPQIAAHDGFELVGVVDPLSDRRQEALITFGVDGYEDLSSCLDTASADLVVIASPTPFHAEQTAAAMAAGCDVFCDKPMAASLEQADAMVAATERLGRKLMLYQPARAAQDVVSLRRILATGLIGPVYMIKYARTSYTRRNDWQAMRRHGGGMLNNYGAHVIDVCLHVAASRAERITCHLETIASLGDADDVVKTVIETTSGVLIDIDINMAAAHPIEPRWHVLGAHGSLVYSEEGWRARFFDPAQLPPLELDDDSLAARQRQYGSGEQIPWVDRVLPIDVDGIDYYEQCHAYFARDEEPFVPLSESRELMRVLDACRRDAGCRVAGRPDARGEVDADAGQRPC